MFRFVDKVVEFQRKLQFIGYTWESEANTGRVRIQWAGCGRHETARYRIWAGPARVKQPLQLMHLLLPPMKVCSRSRFTLATGGRSELGGDRAVTFRAAALEEEDDHGGEQLGWTQRRLLVSF
jgi:hypothetical protein